jgi:hypothetical protein
MRLGLLVEHIYLSGQPLWLGTAHPTAWPAVHFAWETSGVGFLAVKLKPDDAAAGFVAFSSVPFRCRPATDLAAVYGLQGDRARELDAATAAGMLLGVAVAHRDGARLFVSEGWGQLIVEGV